MLTLLCSSPPLAAGTAALHLHCFPSLAAIFGKHTHTHCSSTKLTMCNFNAIAILNVSFVVSGELSVYLSMYVCVCAERATALAILARKQRKTGAQIPTSSSSFFSFATFDCPDCSKWRTIEQIGVICRWFAYNFEYNDYKLRRQVMDYIPRSLIGAHLNLR